MHVRTSIMLVALTCGVAGCGGGGGRGGDDGSSSSAAGRDVLGRTEIPSSDGSFEPYWTVELSDPAVEIRTTPDTVYVNFDDEPLRVEAFDAEDGRSRWTATVAEAGSWLDDYQIVPVETGVLVPYEDGNQQHLALLSNDDGQRVWDIPLERDLHTLIAGAVPGVVSIALSDEPEDWRFVDLNDGTIVPDTVRWWITNKMLVEQDGRTLRYPYDPFDPDADATELALDFDHGPYQEIGEVFVVGDGSTLHGFVDGEERWLSEPGIGAITNLYVLGDHLLAEGEGIGGGQPSMALIGVGPEAAVEIELPASLKVWVADVVGGSPTLVGFEDGIELVVYQVVGDALARRGSVVAPGAEGEVFLDLVAGHLIVGGACGDQNEECHVLSAADLDGLDEVGRWEFRGPGRLSFEGDDAYGINYVENDQTITAYR